MEEAALKLLILAKLTLKEGKNAPGIFACNPVMNGKSTPHK